jgi:quercetin dioxygenase-like cupin family protein
VTIEGETHAIAPGVAIFIPGDALHGVEADDGPARYLYVFAADSFAEVVYRFPADPETEAADVP